MWGHGGRFRAHAIWPLQPGSPSWADSRADGSTGCLVTNRCSTTQTHHPENRRRNCPSKPIPTCCWPAWTWKKRIKASPSPRTIQSSTHGGVRLGLHQRNPPKRRRLDAVDRARGRPPVPLQPCPIEPRQGSQGTRNRRRSLCRRQTQRSSLPRRINLSRFRKRLAAEPYSSLTRLKTFAGSKELSPPRVEEGRQLPLDLTRARLETARAQQQLEAGKAQLRLLEATLKHQISLSPGSPAGAATKRLWQHAPPAPGRKRGSSTSRRRQPRAEAHRRQPPCQGFACERKREHWRRESTSWRNTRCWARFNNFEDFFNKFQRHKRANRNVVPNPGVGRKEVSARAAKVRLETSALEIQRSALRSGIELEVHRKFEELHQAEGQQNWPAWSWILPAKTSA